MMLMILIFLYNNHPFYFLCSGGAASWQVERFLRISAWICGSLFMSVGAFEKVFLSLFTFLKASSTF